MVLLLGRSSATSRTPIPATQIPYGEVAVCAEGKKADPNDFRACALCLGATSSIPLKPALGGAPCLTAVPQTTAGMGKEL